MCGDVAGSQEGCDVETGRAVEEQTHQVLGLQLKG
jgi:hypothetical protein